MPQDLDLEIKVIKRFLNPSKQERYIQFVTSSKNRKKFIADLTQVSFLRQDAFERVQGIEEHVIDQALAREAITDRTCYLISDNPRLDTKTLALSDALQATVGHGLATLLVFGNAGLVYCEGEGLNNRFLSKPNQAS